MNQDPSLVNVFPISTSAFGLRSNWFELFSPKLIQPAFLVMVLFLVISIGIMAMKRFEDPALVKKLWNFPIIIIAATFWPFIVRSLKDLIDTFNTFLVRDVFQIPWEGFGYPEVGSISNVFGWSAEALARFMPNLAYWVMYAFFIIFFFFYAVLGPLVIAKGILYDEIDSFLELIKELTVLLLWQTTVVILVAFLLPDIVSGRSFPANPESNFYFLSLILGVLIFFTATITRKFANHLGSTIFTSGFRWGGAMLGIYAFSRLGGLTAAVVGIKPPIIREPYVTIARRTLKIDEFTGRARQGKKIENLEMEKEDLETELTYLRGQVRDIYESFNIQPGEGGAVAHRSRFVDLSQRAKIELQRGGRQQGEGQT